MYFFVTNISLFLAIICCFDATISAEIITCNVNNQDGICIESSHCNNILRNHGEKFIEPRMACPSGLACCKSETKIQCDIDGLKGICKEKCDYYPLTRNLGEGFLEERRGPVCKKPLMCCPESPSKVSKTCNGICKKTCYGNEKLDLKHGAGLIEERKIKTVCAEDETCCEHKVITKNKCGYINRDITNFIDIRVAPEVIEFPWLVRIARKVPVLGKEKLVYVCAGTLISPKVVLTTAHCIEDHSISTLTIRAGVYNVPKSNENPPDQLRNIKKVIMHDDFERETHINNIALLILTSEFELNPHIQPACLPPMNTDEENLAQKCIVSGWGQTSTDLRPHYINSNFSEIPKKVELNVISSKSCQEKLRKTKLGPLFELHESFICAFGQSGEDACKGNGGAPLMCPIPGEALRYYSAGIVSWGIGCGENPGVYVNLGKYRDWIDSQLEGIDTVDDN